jgi:hypothetical protein
VTFQTPSQPHIFDLQATAAVAIMAVVAAANTAAETTAVCFIYVSPYLRLS